MTSKSATSDQQRGRRRGLGERGPAGHAPSGAPLGRIGGFEGAASAWRFQGRIAMRDRGNDRRAEAAANSRAVAAAIQEKGHDMSRKIGVVGAGLMGAEIALVFALAGHDVLLNDGDASSLERAMGRLRMILEKGVARGFYAKNDVEPALRNIRPVSDLATFADRDLVTEAVFEAQDVKATVLGALDGICNSGCLIATNTSTIPISTLAAGLAAPRRMQFIGTHYFSPVARMKLVEVIPGFDTGNRTVAAVMALMSEIGKTPIQVKDVAGFAVNRMLHAFLIEAVRLVEEGVATPEDLDIACRLGLGHPIGPFALMDAVTSSLCVQAQEIMQESYGDRFRPPPLLKQRVRGGFGGGKGKPGWLVRSEKA